MVIHEFHLLRIALTPDEAYPPLVIDADAVLSGPAAFQGFQPVARRCQQIAQLPCPVQELELAPGGVLNVRRQFPRAFASKDTLGFVTPEGGYHIKIIPRFDNMSSSGRGRVLSLISKSFLDFELSAPLCGFAPWRLCVKVPVP